MSRADLHNLDPNQDKAAIIDRLGDYGTVLHFKRTLDEDNKPTAHAVVIFEGKDAVSKLMIMDQMPFPRWPLFIVPFGTRVRETQPVVTLPASASSQPVEVVHGTASTGEPPHKYALRCLCCDGQHVCVCVCQAAPCLP